MATTLAEKIKTQIIAYEAKIDECNNIIENANVRKAVFTEALKTLEYLYEEALESETDISENTEPAKPKRQPRRKKIESDIVDTENTEDIKIDDNANITMKQLADELNTTTVVIADICNKLNINKQISKNNYMLTEEQANSIKAQLKTENK